MKRLISLLLLVTTPVFAASKSPYTDVSKPIVVKANKPYFTVRLKANATTGYHWILDADNTNQYISAEKEKYSPAVSQLMGAPGTSIWTFRVLPHAFRVPTKMTITLLYTRPWEAGQHAGTKKVITVVTANS